MEQEFDGDELAKLLKKPGAAAVATALLGCSYYRTDPEVLEVITSCDVNAATVNVTGSSGGRERRVALAGGYVISDHGLVAAAIQLLETDADREQRAMESRLAVLGITSRVEAEDLNTLHEGLEALDRGELPNRSSRGRCIGLVEKYGSDRTGLKLINSMIAVVPRDKPVPGDLTIALVSLLRRLNDQERAFEATNTLISDANGLSEAERRILFTQRAALWLDRYEARSHPEALKKARACADNSWAIEPSSQCSLVYQRLKKLEADMADEHSEIAVAKRERSLAQARTDWHRPKPTS